MKFRDLFRSRPAAYRIPGGDVPTLYLTMLDQPHVLIAGASGSGKSVVLNGIVTTLLHRDSPTTAQLVLIDPKRVELGQYARLPHTIAHLTEPADIVRGLHDVLTTIDQRYREAARAGVKKYDGADIYVIIDELADLMTTNKKEVQPALQRIMQIGRAARVHVIAATQCPLASVIPTAIKCNFSGILGLHTRSAQDSRNILGISGLETLPMYGQGAWLEPGQNVQRCLVRMVDQRDQDAMIRWWTSKACVA